MLATRTRFAISISLALVCAGAGTISAQLTSDQQKCVTTLNKGFEKLAQTIGKETRRCIRDYNKGNDLSDIDQCIADDRNGKMASIEGRNVDKDASRCAGNDGDGIPREPGVFYANAPTSNSLAGIATNLEAIVYDAPVGSSAIIEAQDTDAARCQEHIAKLVQKCHRTRLAEFNRCKKNILKSGGDTPAALAACLTDDSRGKIARLCDQPTGSLDPIRKDLDRKCIDKGIDLSVAFPRCGATDRDSVHACLVDATACLVCTGLDNADGLEADCDIVDNQANDNSCPACGFLGACVLDETSVSPAATDPAIDDPVGGNHLIYVNPHVPEGADLLVHLPGTFGTPSGNSNFLEAVANQGMKAIGLQYVNDGTVNGICFNEWTNNPPADPDCQAKLRLERIYGTDSSPLENVSPANSLVNRLVKLLEYLDTNQPTVGWGDYLNAGQPRWDMIAFSGHSQGSGMAVLIARDHAVARVLMFGGPSDFDPQFNTADWMTDPKATSINLHYGFRHQQDQQFPVLQTWSDMGLPGPPVLVDKTEPPFANSHFLETNIPVATGFEHSSVIRNAQLEQGDAPTFEEVWEYMCCSL